MSDKFQLKFNKAKVGKGFLVDEDERGVLPANNLSKSMSKEGADDFIRELFKRANR